jgi:VCBS repeat-containing protein
VTIIGTNDAPTITSTAAAATGSVTELAGVSGSTATDLATGTLTFKDVDLIDTHTATVVAQGAGYLGNFTLGAIADSTGGVTGSVGWTFSVVDGALDFLAAGQTLVQSYNVTVADNHGGTAVQVVTVTLTGTNDAPVAQAIAIATSATGPAVTLTASYTDLDLIDTHTFTVNTVGTLGAVTNNGNGTFGYNPNGQFASLALGQTATDHFTYTVADNHGGTSTQTATVTIAGANHAPVITSPAAAASVSVIELAGVTGSAAVDTAAAALTFTDADPTDLHTASVVALGTGYLGVFTLGTVAESNATGVVVGSVPWSFSVVDGTLDFLAAGQTVVQSYSVKIADPNGGTVVQTVTVTLTGTNDAPTIAATTKATGAVLERPGVLGSPLLDTATGIVAFKDVDLTDTHTVSVAPQAAGYLGTLTLGTRTDSTNGVTGSVPWSFSVVDSALDFLSAGQTLVQNYNVTVADNHGGAVVQVVTVTLTGSNDAPAFTSPPFVASVNEHGPGVTLTPSFTDVDLLDQHVFTVDTTGTRGLVTNIQGGTIVYDPNGAFASLSVGQTAVDHFSYSVVDNNGASATQTATVTIIGQNDAPVANPDTISVAAGTTSANLWTTLLANDTDVDTAHTALVISSVNTNGTTGSVSLNTATHSLTYRAPAGGAPDSFQYTVSDGQGGSSSTTVTVNADHLVTDNWVVSPGQIATFSAASVLANDTAAGGGALTLLAVSGPNASLSGGVITYSSPGGASDSFTYKTVDSHGTQATGTVNVSLWDGSSTPVGSATNQAEWLVGSSTAPITMIGTAIADHLQGSVGSDIITGGGGADVLTGGGGINHFIYNNAGTIGVGASNKDSSLGAMDHITDFVSGTDIIELNGFGFSAASTAAVTATNLKAKPFTSGDVAGYFADGNAIHFEKQTTTVSAQIYIDANKDGSFEAASDIVIHLDHSKGVTNLDFQFH